MVFVRFSRKRILYGTIAVWLGLFVSVSQIGCGRSIISFDIASGSLTRPVMDLEMNLGATGNLRRVFHRIRWMEQLREWESRLQLHALSSWLGDSPGGRLKQCGASCSRCFSGNESVGEIALVCWTQADPPTYKELQNTTTESLRLKSAQLSGLMKLEVPTIQKSGGEGYMTWDQVCSVATRKLDSTQDGLCLSGLSAYKVTIDDEITPQRLDFLWVVRVTIYEGVGDALTERRLDGVIGSFFTEREDVKGVPAVFRKAILIDEKNILYNQFQTKHCKDNGLPGYRDCCGSVSILASDGQYLCSFIGAGTPANQKADCTPAALNAVTPVTIGAFEVRCQKQ